MSLSDEAMDTAADIRTSFSDVTSEEEEDNHHVLNSKDSSLSLEEVSVASDFRSVASEQHESPTTSTKAAVAAVPAVTAAAPAVPIPTALQSLPECIYGPAYNDPSSTTAAAADDAVTQDGGTTTTTTWTAPSLAELSTSQHEISIARLRKIAAAGIPEEDDEDQGSCRGVAWRVLLGYLPVQVSEWEAQVQTQRALYCDFVQDLFGDVPDLTDSSHELRGRRRRHMPVQDESETDPSHSSATGDPVTITATPSPAAVTTAQQQQQQQLLKPEQVLPVEVKDYWKKQGKDLHVLENLTRNMNALSLQESPTETEQPWRDFCESCVLLDEIRKDVVRTHPDLAFYLEPEKGPRRYAALERILFVWSKYNKGVRYVQGMNEIVGTVYYVLANDANDVWADHAEVDTYWLLNTLLADMRDVFVAELDDAVTGIGGRISAMHGLLGRHDPEVKEHLDEIGIDTAYYAIRWWTTLLSREFLLPDTIRLWDSMFASTHKDNFLRYVCVTMVMVVREDLLKGDFSTCLRMLQSYPSTHMDRLLESSRALWVYESQITLACHKGGISLHQALQTISPPPAVIMAFGLRDGVVSLTPQEQLEEAGDKVAARVKVATNAAAASAQGLFGRASRFYKKKNQQYKTRYQSQSADGVDEGGVAKSTSVGSLEDKNGSEQGILQSKSADSALETKKEEISAADQQYFDAIFNA